MVLSESGSRALGWLTASLAGRPIPALVIAIGLGDGGLLEALAAVAPATRVLALEPDAAAPLTPTSALSADWRAAGRLVHLTAPDFTGADQAWRVFPANPEDHHLVVHPESAVRARAQAVRAARVVQQVLFGVRANAEARRQFAAPYLLNTLRNVPAISRGADVMALRDVYAGTPAVVVGAGPSLDAVMPALAAAATRALVIATDTTLRPLLHAGVTPPLVAGVDPSTANARHFLALPVMRESWLVAESALAPAAVSAFAGRTFWFRAGAHQPWPFLAESGVMVSQMPVWGSVLTAAYQVAMLAGCDPIVFVGADLAFTGGRPYARGTTYEFDWAYSAALGADLAQVWQMQMAMRDCLPAVDLHGRETVTTAPLQSFRDWIVAHAAGSGRRVVNASGDGILHGPGIEIGDLAAVLGTGRPVRPIAAVAKPPACANPNGLRSQLAGVRAAVAAEQGVEARAWAEFASERYDAAAVTRALDDALADDGGAAPPRSFVPWAALPGRLSSYPYLCQLPERMAAHQARLNGRAPSGDGPRDGAAGPSGDDLRALTSLLAPLLSGLANYREDPAQPVARHSAMGVAAVAGERDWPSQLAWPMQIFESAAVAPSPADGAGTFLRAPVRLRDAATVAATVTTVVSSDTARARTRLVAEWLGLVASCADAVVTDTGALARLRAIVAGAADTDAAGPTSGAECVLLPDADCADRAVAVRFAVDERPLARVLTGALVPVEDAAAQAGAARSRGDRAMPAVTIRVGAWRAQCAVGPTPDSSGLREPSALWAAHHVAPVVLTEAGMARSAFAYGTPRGAVCVGMHARESVLVSPDGTVAPHLSWPRPVIGELPLGQSGAVAWSNGTADWPQVGEGYVLYRLTADGPVVEEALPFRPTNGAWWQGRLYWSTYPTGIGAWAPGEAPRQWLPDESFSGVRPAADHLALAACALEPWGGYARRLVRASWRLTPCGMVEPASLGRRGAATSLARHVQGWTAIAHPQADCVALRHPAAAPFDLTCYDPVAVAWTGDSLVACTGEGEVLLFADLAVRLTAI